MNRLRCRNAQGFTIVEMIVAIVLVSIIALTLFSRFSNPSSFDQAIASDNLIALALLAQQTSLGRENVTFEIDPIGGFWEFSVAVSGAVVRSVAIPGNTVLLKTGSTIIGTCGVDINDDITGNFKVSYGGGNIAGFTNSASSPVTVGNGVRICVNGSVEYSACISPAGFAYLGECDD